MRVEWSLRASRALNMRANFLARKAPRAAAAAKATIRAAAERLAEFPNIGRPYARDPDGYRELVVPFGSEGYMLLYYVEHDCVVISRLKHQREASY